jgi:hypothetical protein
MIAGMPSRRLAFLVSAGALLVALVHVLWPDLEIDAVTVVLLAVAAVPWLGPIFKSIELPGGWKFEYQVQQIREQVEQVERRVQDVERLVFTGDTTPAMEEQLTRAVQGFAGYLRGVDDALVVPLPSVALKSGLGNAQYVGSVNEIQIDPKLAEDDYVVMREYAHHVLMTVGPTWDTRLLGVESGVADYLVASHTGHPALGAGAARAFGLDRPALRDLANERSYSEGLIAQDEGEIWGGALWELRSGLGREAVDRAVAGAWLDPGWVASGALAFADAVVAHAGEGARDAFRRRGLLL